MVVTLSPPSLKKTSSVKKDSSSLKSNRYNQLEIYSYILECRTPTLKELCARIPSCEPPKKIAAKKPRRRLSEHDQKYPKNWIDIARQIKEERNYTCQICGLKCLRPEDNREHLTLSEIGKLTANTHHIDGNTFNNSPSNLLVVCSTHHLQIHQGRRSNPPKGQIALFDLSSI